MVNFMALVELTTNKFNCLKEYFSASLCYIHLVYVFMKCF